MHRPYTTENMRVFFRFCILHFKDRNLQSTRTCSSVFVLDGKSLVCTSSAVALRFFDPWLHPHCEARPYQHHSSAIAERLASLSRATRVAYCRPSVDFVL